jgi:hypothetical protein
MKKFSIGLALSLIKAAALTVIVLTVITSCDRVADHGKTYSNEWRGTVLKTGRPLTVKNIDSLCVVSGDTVTVFLMDTPTTTYYYISNTPEKAADTAAIEMYIDGKDTIYEKFEAWNVRLERRIAR